jgi:hypothetical protein
VKIGQPGDGGLVVGALAGVVLVQLARECANQDRKKIVVMAMTSEYE